MGALDCTCYCGGMNECPACGHGNEEARLTRGDWLWPFNKPILIRCSLLTTEQDALVDNESVCNCADGWHTDVALRQEA
jgi:hypothetical protein